MTVSLLLLLLIYLHYKFVPPLFATTSSVLSWPVTLSWNSFSHWGSTLFCCNMLAAAMTSLQLFLWHITELWCQPTSQTVLHDTICNSECTAGPLNPQLTGNMLPSTVPCCPHNLYLIGNVSQDLVLYSHKNISNGKTSFNTCPCKASGSIYIVVCVIVICLYVCELMYAFLLVS